MSASHASGAVCEIEVELGQPCGVTAVRRCATCQRAFCLTHQAKNSFYSLDQCLSCQQRETADREAAKSAEEDAERAARLYFTSGAARDALLASNVQLDEIACRVLRHQKTIFSVIFDADRRCVEVVESAHGWVLGETAWRWEGQDRLGVSLEGYGTWFAALLDDPQRDGLGLQLGDRNFPAGLIPVSSGPHGYALVSWVECFDEQNCQYVTPGGGHGSIEVRAWSTLVQSVKRMAERFS